ncbi:MAG: hypothetical protein KIS64_01150 [Fimbriimonadaceae bacterium]|nr:hypothetical protein [Fimbriimonadaceae bacterium]
MQRSSQLTRPSRQWSRLQAVAWHGACQTLGHALTLSAGFVIGGLVTSLASSNSEEGGPPMALAVSRGLVAGFTPVGLAAAAVGGVFAGLQWGLDSASRTASLITVLAAAVVGWLTLYKPWGPGSFLLDVYPLMLRLLGAYLGFIVIARHFHSEAP